MVEEYTRKMHTIPISDIQFIISDQLFPGVLDLEFKLTEIKSKRMEGVLRYYVPKPDGYWKVKKCQHIFVV